VNGVGDDEDNAVEVLPPWEVYPEDADEDAVRRALQSQGDATLAACRRVEEACATLVSLVRLAYAAASALCRAVR